MPTKTQQSHNEKGPQRNNFLRWWPCFLVVALLLWSIIDQAFLLNINTTAMVSSLINGIGVLAIIIYVIYTKDLAEASIKTAEANVQLVASMQSRILEDWECRKCSPVNLIRGGDHISEVLHISDKQINTDAYERFKGCDTPYILIFKPLNMGPRPVVLKKVKFVVSDTRCKVERDLSWNPSSPVVLSKDERIELHICYDMEGMLSARIAEIEYQDGEINQVSWIANPFSERRREIEQEVESYSRISVRSTG